MHFTNDAVQRFVEFPTYTEVNPGEDALLKCRISDKKGVCSWQKDNKVWYLSQNNIALSFEAEKKPDIGKI
ncbi:unnamed protein product [Leptosia nina]|uniref:Ig-like domain-containing protein n=1 Tax=Leptosia nina TaxID=320188 RepID=A0AAV1JRK4_9NEOP